MKIVKYNIEFKTLEDDGTWKYHEKLIFAYYIDDAIKHFDIVDGPNYKKYELISIEEVN